MKPMSPELKEAIEQAQAYLAAGGKIYQSGYGRYGDPPLSVDKGELLLTTEHISAYIDSRLAARKLLRPDRQAYARKGVETKRKNTSAIPCGSALS